MKVTIRDVAKVAGTSYATVSNVINDKRGAVAPSEKTKQKVWDAIRETGYKPNFAARALSSGKTNIIACLVSLESNALFNPFFHPILAGAQEVLIENSYSMLIESSEKYLGQKDRNQAMQTMIMPDAFLITSADMTNDFSYIGEKPAIFVACNAQCERSARVTTDEYTGAQLAATHLHDLGHRHIALLRSTPGGEADHVRYTSVCEKLQALGLIVDDALIGVADGTRHGGREAMVQILERGVPFSAVLGFNDNMALGAMDVLRDKGISVPEDVSVVGFDDLPGISRYEGLTTVEVPVADLGREAARKLIAALHNPKLALEDKLFDVALVKRNSTRVLED